MVLVCKLNISHVGLLAAAITIGSCCTTSSSQAPEAVFSWTPYPSLSYATALPKIQVTPTYASAYSVLSTLIANQSTTTWTSIANPTDTAKKYGNIAWSSQWVNYTEATSPPFTTTTLATSIPSSELIKPTPLPYLTEDGQSTNYIFPKDFLYGFAGAALQVEGTIKSEGRGPAMTEITLIAREEVAKGGGSPDITDLNYYLYKQDIARLAAVGVKAYSFSISWSRILPFAVPGSPVNQQGIGHYDDLINTILEYGMTPIVTLHHFDTPLYYQTSTSWQGWDHPEFVEGFLNYAKIVLTHYSDRVGTWISFNEPGTDQNALNWATAYNILMAHAKVVHWYREVLQGTGKWSTKLSFKSGFALPLDPTNGSDIAAAQRYTDFTIEYFADPLFLGLQTPESVLSTLGSKAAIFTDDELAFIHGTCDFLAVDLYTAIYYSAPAQGIHTCAANSSDPLFPYCVTNLVSRAGWNIGADSSSGAYIIFLNKLFQQHLRQILQYMSLTWPSDGGIVIAEFGFPAWSESSMPLATFQADIMHSTCYYSILNGILKSINEDGINVSGAIGWSFVDNWEWGEYDDRYGVQAFNSTTLERSYKRSIFDFVGFIEAHLDDGDDTLLASQLGRVCAEELHLEI